MVPCFWACCGARAVRWTPLNSASSGSRRPPAKRFPASMASLASASSTVASLFQTSRRIPSTPRLIVHLPPSKQISVTVPLWPQPGRRPRQGRAYGAGADLHPRDQEQEGTRPAAASQLIDDLSGTQPGQGAEQDVVANAPPHRRPLSSPKQASLAKYTCTSIARGVASNRSSGSLVLTGLRVTVDGALPLGLPVKKKHGFYSFFTITRFDRHASCFLSRQEIWRTSVPTSIPPRLARLRARATGESYQIALRAIERTTADEPVVAAPVPEQEQLEGWIVERLHNLSWYSSRPGSSDFSIQRITPGFDQLIIELEEGSSIREFVGHVMPVVPPAADELVGVPGLRARPHLAGVSLYRPGLQGEVIVRGTTADQWEAIHEASYHGPDGMDGCAARISPLKWTRAEREFDPWRRDQLGDPVLQREAEDHILRSALLRRIGLFNRLRPASISTWRSIDRKGIVVEVFQPDCSALDRDVFIRALTSPRFFPHLELVKARPADPDGYFRLGTTALASMIELRLVTLIHVRPKGGQDDLGPPSLPTCRSQWQPRNTSLT